MAFLMALWKSKVLKKHYCLVPRKDRLMVQRKGLLMAFLMTPWQSTVSEHGLMKVQSSEMNWVRRKARL